MEGALVATAAGFSGSSVEGKLDKLVDGQAKVVELLEAKAVKVYRFSEGKTGKSQAVETAMVQLDLVSTTPGELPRWPRTGPFSSYSFSPYQWPADYNEEKESPKLLKHFETEMAKLDVKLGKDGFEVQDVRGQDRLSFQCSTATATLAFNGGTDAVITPFGEQSWELQVRAVIDWKTPRSLTAYNTTDIQQKLELIGALHHSNHPAIVIFTDLVNFVIYQPHGKAIRYFHTFQNHAAGSITSSDAMRLVAHHLTRVSSKEPAFHYQQLESIAEHSELRQRAAPLLAAKKLGGAGEGLLEQLGLVTDLPPDQQLEAASETILAWRHELSYFS